MKVSIFGLGYVGAVSAGCLCRLGHEVVGVDPIDAKREKITSGQSPVIEPELEELISEAVGAGRLRVTQDVREAICGTEVSLICVGTPSRRDGSINLDYVSRVCKQIGEALRDHQGYHAVAVRSTMLPGAAEASAIAELESASGRKVGEDFGFCVNPEFLREGSAVKDFMNPPKTVIGAFDKRSATTVSQLYDRIEAPLFVTAIPVAAAVKYVDNAFHALKVVFGNEIGLFCKSLGIDSHQVMDVVCADRKLNISPAYLMPGFAFGGSCLPKDLRAILDYSRQGALSLPLLSSLLPSNDLHIRRFVDDVVAERKKTVGVLGLAFKPGTDDLRESPIVTVVEMLIGKGFDLRIYDKNVSLASLVGANREYILNEIPHISSLICTDLNQVVDHGEILIVANRDDLFADALRRRAGDKVVFDLARQFSPEDPVGARYLGICW